MRNWLQRVMAGRYGPDQLYFALFIAALLLNIVGAFFGGSIVGLILDVLGYGLLVWAIVRSLSRNMYARRRENDRFLRYWWPVRTKLSGFMRRLKCSKTHRFFKCPGCGNMLRVPKGKGKIEITCPRCGERFRRKT